MVLSTAKAAAAVGVMMRHKRGLLAAGLSAYAATCDALSEVCPVLVAEVTEE
jgi:hypothetical protein